MTKKLYDLDSYQKEFSGKVLSVEKTDQGYLTILDQTLFFPEEGGQTPDKGYFYTKNPAELSSEEKTESGIPVLDVQIDKEGIITHLLSVELTLEDIIYGELDWAHRFNNMQQHTGEHIFSGLVYDAFGFNNVGFHLSDHIVTMDYDGAISEADVYLLEKKANLVISRNIPVLASYPATDELEHLAYRSKLALTENIRIVSIPDVDVCACCAPHLASTAEVGCLKVLSVQNYKGGVRLSILCGLRAMNYIQDAMTSLQQSARLLSVKAEDLPDSIQRTLDSIGTLKQQLSVAKREVLNCTLKEINPDDTNVLLFTEGIDSNQIRNTINELMEIHPGYIAIFNGSDSAGYTYIIGSKARDVREIGTALREQLQAKGGGQATMIQGSVQASEESIHTCLETII